MSQIHRKLGIAFLLLTAASFSHAQDPPAANPAASTDKAAAYYHYSVGHLYAELASAFGNRGDLFNKAVENYKLALKNDPGAVFITEELSDLYIQANRLREAVTENEELLKQDPSNLNARRVLARIYSRLMGDQQQNKIDESMVKKAIEQYQKIIEKDSSDVESWVKLGGLQKIAQNSVDAEKAFKKALELDPNNEDALTGLALVYSDLGNTKDATDLLRKAAEKNPNQRSLITLASSYEQMKEYSLAAETLKKALEQSPGNVEIQRGLAQDLLFADQLDQALKIYEQLAADDPKDVQSRLRISQVYRQKREFAKARKASDEAKELDPNNLEIQYNEVSLLESEGKFPEAVKSLKDILSATAHKSYNPSEKANRIMLLERLALIYRTSEQTNPAVEAYRQISELDPDAAPKVAAQVVDTYRAAHEYPKADQEAEAAVKKYPEDRAVRSVRASLFADIGKIDQAVAETRKLLNGKDDREVHLSLAQIYLKAKNFGEMAKALDAADKLSTSKEDKETVAFLRGSMFEQQKNYDGAEAEFRRVLAANPENGSAMNYLGYMLADRNTRLEEARGLIVKALEREPNNGAYLDSLGWVYYRMNRLDDAEKSLLKSLEMMAKDPTVHDHLGDVYFQKGKIREAIGQWQNSLKAWQTGSPSEVDRAEVAKVQKKLDGAKIKLARDSK